MWASLLRRIAVRRIAATGLFDPAFYRATNFDVAASGANPIRHYVKRGAAEGRDPHAMFDTSYYVRENPDVSASGLNPLLHFAKMGAAEGRRPHPRYTAEEYLKEAARLGRGSRRSRAVRAGDAYVPTRPRFTVRPIVAGPAVTREAGHGTAVILVCHVLPYPPQAGNEYRIHRLLQWLRSAGCDVHVVVSPLPGDLLDPAHVREAAKQYPNLVVCLRDGTVLHQSQRAAVRSTLAALEGERSRKYPRPESTPRIARLERTFCPDHLMHVLQRLGEALRPDAVVASYVFMSRSLRLFRDGAVRIIDTHDVFSTKGRKVVQFGVADDLAMSPEEEAAMLSRGDVIMAIQPEEERELRALAPDRRVITVGVDFDVPREAAPVAAPVVLCVASGNPLNVRGVRELVSLAWPLVRREVPAARLRIVGPVCDALDADVDGVELLGRIGRLEAAYAGARVVVNPTVAGTGLKIKTLEALSNLRPLVSWPSGVDGVSATVRRFCLVATDWYEFSRHLVRLLVEDPAVDPVAHHDEIREALSPEVVYADLLAAMGLPREAPAHRSAGALAEVAHRAAAAGGAE